MPQVHRVEVRLHNRIKIHVLDTYGLEAEALGLPVPEHVEVASVYLLVGSFDQPAIERLIEDLLCDPVTENAGWGCTSGGTVIGPGISSSGSPIPKLRRWNLPPNVCWALRPRSHRHHMTLRPMIQPPLRTWPAEPSRTK